MNDSGVTQSVNVTNKNTLHWHFMKQKVLNEPFYIMCLYSKATIKKYLFLCLVKVRPQLKICVSHISYVWDVNTKIGKLLWIDQGTL